MEPLPYPTEITEAPLGIDPRIRRFRCDDEVATFVVVTERWLVIVDTHSTPALALQFAEQCIEPADAGRLLVVNTHADYDHAWGNQVFSGPEARYPAPVIGHALCAERLGGDDAAISRAKMEKEQPGRFDDLVLTPPNITVGDEGLTIDGGDLTLILVHTPGHTEDHFSIWIPELRIILAGDAAEQPWPHVDTPEGIAQARASLVRLQELDPLHVLPCHGDTTERALLDRNIAYLDAVAGDPTLPIEDAARIAGVTVADLDPIYVDFHRDALAASAAIPDGPTPQQPPR
jgi:glyoxylase-like metal-dependent hydrolase (beta-lactamase superfamily II)